MSDAAAVARPSLGIFERGLSLWVALAILFGIALGNIAPGVMTAISALEVAHVNLPVAILIWAMIFPMMVNVDFSSLRHVGERPKGLVVTMVINWLVKPFTMAALGVLFLEGIFGSLIPPDVAQSYIAGMILLGVAPCTAMVFVWSELTRGDATYTLVQVALNDLIMIFAFAPIAAFLLGANNIHVPWNTLLFSVLLYVVTPLAAGAHCRRRLLNRGGAVKVARFTAQAKPYTIAGLLLTVVLLFAFQGERIIAEPYHILLIAIPLVVQSYGIFAIAYVWAWGWRIPYPVAAPCALIGTSNFFELAVAVAISLFGLHSGAALATVVGVLVEVPVMLSLVTLANRTRPLFDRRSG